MYTYIVHYCNQCRLQDICKFKESKELLEDDMGKVQPEQPEPYSTKLSCGAYEAKSQPTTRAARSLMPGEGEHNG